MERNIDKERYFVIRRLENRYYTYTIRNDTKFIVNNKVIRIIMTECISKPSLYEYFTFINGVYYHLYKDALKMIKELGIAKEPLPVYEAPECSLEDLF